MMDNFAVIHVGATYDDRGNKLSISTRWEGDTDLTRITTDLMADLDTRFVYWETPDKVFILGSFRLEYIGRDNAYWYFRRIDDAHRIDK